MQEHKPNQMTQEVSQFSWIASIVILFTTLLAIGWLKTYTYIQESNIVTLQSEIVKLEEEIQSASTDKDLIIANILKWATIRPSLDLKTFVRGFRLAAAQANVRLNGFNISDDTITSSLTATRDTSVSDAVEIIISMMRIQNPNTKLSLQPIYSVSWSPTERSTSVTFRILPSNPTENVSK